MTTLIKIILALIAIVIAIAACFGAWRVTGALIAGSFFEDVSDILKVSVVFITLSLFEKLYNLAEKWFPDAH